MKIVTRLLNWWNNPTAALLKDLVRRTNTDVIFWSERYIRDNDIMHGMFEARGSDLQ